MPADPLAELLTLLRQARREVAVTVLGPVELCSLDHRETVHRLIAALAPWAGRRTR